MPQLDQVKAEEIAQLAFEKLQFPIYYQTSETVRAPPLELRPYFVPGMRIPSQHLTHNRCHSSSRYASRFRFLS